jgi:hypothetical protein
MKLFLNENPIRVSYRANFNQNQGGRAPGFPRSSEELKRATRVSLERFRRMLGMLDHFGIISIAARKRCAAVLLSDTLRYYAIEREEFLFTTRHKYTTSSLRNSPPFQHIRNGSASR